jgi:hypothetical protein
MYKIYLPDWENEEGEEHPSDEELKEAGMDLLMDGAGGTWRLCTEEHVDWDEIVARGYTEYTGDPVITVEEYNRQWRLANGKE